MKRCRTITGLLIVFSYILFFVGSYCYSNWGYLPFQNPDFGFNFNDDRNRLGLPPVEDYFYDKQPRWKRRKIWLTPDSLKGKQLHYSKLYWTKRGEITREFDFYNPIEEQPYDTIVVRRYFYESDSVSFELSASKRETEISSVSVYRQELTEQQFDSVLREWKTKLKH